MPRESAGCLCEFCSREAVKQTAQSRRDAVYLLKFEIPPNAFAGFAPDGTVALVVDRKADVNDSERPHNSDLRLREPEYTGYDTHGNKTKSGYLPEIPP